MGIEEIIAYVLVVASVIVGVRAFSSGDGAVDYRQGREAGWSRLPLAFKLLWGFAIAFETTVGATMAELMPRSARRYDQLIKSASLPLTPQRVFACVFFFTVFMVLFGAVFCAGIYLMMPNLSRSWAVFIILVFLIMGWFWPTQDILHVSERRQAEITRQLPFAIDLIGSAMRSGLEFGAAVRHYTSIGAGGALEEEFTRVLNDVSLNRSFIDSLKDMADRVQIEAFTAFVGVVSYGTEIGASISETLRTQGKELRRTRFALAERKAARAPSVMIIPLVCFIMPAVFIVIITPVVLKYKAMGLGLN